jgi:hypothetical protein
MTKVWVSPGHWMTVPRDTLSAALPASAGRADISRTKKAFVKIRIPSECAKGINQGPPYYGTLLVKIAGVQHRISDLKLPAKCAKIFVSPYYQ